MSVIGGKDKAVFGVYLEQLLVSKLVPGDIVIMDKLSTDKISGIREAIEAALCQSVLLAHQKLLVQAQSQRAKSQGPQLH